MLKQYMILGLILVGTYGCGSSDEDSDLDGLDLGEHEGEVDPNSFKLYTLPSPLQIATAVKLFDKEYTEIILSPTNKSEANFSNNFQKAVNLGIYSIDMGYATLYEQNQATFYYLAIIEKLSRELDIRGGFNTSSVKRFETNIQQQDSLYSIILSTFSNTHRYLQENDREDAGLLIIAGSFIEGLYISSQLAARGHDIQLKNLIGQQKIYLQNLTELLERYETQDDIAKLNNSLRELSALYDDVEVIYHESNILRGQVSMTEDQLKAISAKINHIRNEVVG